MEIPWETLDETNQITSDFFHIFMKGVIKWELYIVIPTKLMEKNMLDRLLILEIDIMLTKVII